MQSSTREGAVLEALGQPRAVIWTVFLVLGLALVMTAAPGLPAAPMATRLTHFGLVALAGTWVALLTMGALYALRRRLSGTDPVRIGWLALALLLGATWLVAGGALLVAAALQVPVRSGELLLRSTACALTVGVLSLGAFQALWENRRLQARVRRSELAALQARTNPHFLFNTLNTAVALASQRPQEVERLLLNLSDLFRAALGSPHQVALGEELDLVRKYLDIEALRFGERLQVRWQLPAQLPDTAVPRLSIQPLAENAVMHGVERGGDGTVEISVDSNDGCLHVRVRNRLPGALAPARAGHGIGLEVVRERVLALSGGDGQLRTWTDQGWHVAELRLPMQVPQQAASAQATTR